MSFLNFVNAHIEEIRNYVQPSIHWRENGFAVPVAKAEATGGDFAAVIKELPAELNREQVVECFREDLYKGFVATILWGGLNRFRPEEIALRNDRNTCLPKLERLKGMLQQDTDDDVEKIYLAMMSMAIGGENKFYGIGPSYFTKLLHFLSFDNEMKIRPMIYDTNMKAPHFALMPEFGNNPWWFYFPYKENGKVCLELASFETVYPDYCEFMCEAAETIGVDVVNLESWLFGWPRNVHRDRPNPRTEALHEVERISEVTTYVKGNGKINDLIDAINVGRVLYDNGLRFESFFSWWDDLSLPRLGADIEHPIVINETDGYVQIEYLVAQVLMTREHLMFFPTKQKAMITENRHIDKLTFKVWPIEGTEPASEDPSEKRDYEIYFDFTAAYEAAQQRQIKICL